MITSTSVSKVLTCFWSLVSERRKTCVKSRECTFSRSSVMSKSQGKLQYSNLMFKAIQAERSALSLLSTISKDKYNYL